jgi:hypothetical protein
LLDVKGRESKASKKQRRARALVKSGGATDR